MADFFFSSKSLVIAIELFATHILLGEKDRIVSVHFSHIARVIPLKSGIMLQYILHLLLISIHIRKLFRITQMQKPIANLRR